jgi:hypothetical protein
MDAASAPKAGSPEHANANTPNTALSERVSAATPHRNDLQRAIPDYRGADVAEKHAVLFSPGGKPPPPGKSLAGT